MLRRLCRPRAISLAGHGDCPRDVLSPTADTRLNRRAALLRVLARNLLRSLCACARDSRASAACHFCWGGLLVVCAFCFRSMTSSRLCWCESVLCSCLFMFVLVWCVFVLVRCVFVLFVCGFSRHRYFLRRSSSGSSRKFVRLDEESDEASSGSYEESDSGFDDEFRKPSRYRIQALMMSSGSHRVIVVIPGF